MAKTKKPAPEAPDDMERTAVRSETPDASREPEKSVTDKPEIQTPKAHEDSPPSEQVTPYTAVVIPALLVARREPDGPPVATLTGGAVIRVTARRDGYAQIENGLYVRESMIRHCGA